MFDGMRAAPFLAKLSPHSHPALELISGRLGLLWRRSDLAPALSGSIGQSVARVASVASLSPGSGVQNEVRFTTRGHSIASPVRAALWPSPADTLCARTQGYADGFVGRCGGRADSVVYDAEAICRRRPGIWCRHDRGRQGNREQVRWPNGAGRSARNLRRGNPTRGWPDVSPERNGGVPWRLSQCWDGGRGGGGGPARHPVCRAGGTPVAREGGGDAGGDARGRIFWGGHRAEAGSCVEDAACRGKTRGETAGDAPLIGWPHG